MWAAALAITSRPPTIPRPTNPQAPAAPGPRSDSDFRFSPPGAEVEAIALEMIGPMPGTIISRLHAAF